MRKRPVPLRKRLAETNVTIDRVRVDGKGRAFRTRTTPSGNDVVEFVGTVIGHEPGLTIREDGSQRGEAAGFTIQAKILIRPMACANDLEKFLKRYRKLGMRLTQCWIAYSASVADRYQRRGWGPRGPNNQRIPCPVGEPLPVREDYRQWEGCYVWSVSGGDSAAYDTLRSDDRCVCLRQTFVPQGTGASMGYRRLEDQRRANRPDKLPYNHGSGYGNSEGRRLSAP